MRPLAVDLYCGLGGWSEGLLAEGWDVLGFDIEAHRYGSARYPGQLVIQDVLTIHGSQFKGASLIVASPPCQEFSYMAMPWTRAKQIARGLRGEGPFPEGFKGSRTRAELTALFDACFRIQREASEAAGHHIPMVVENVRGAQPWVGRARANFGSFYLWGDVPALMPKPHKARKVPGFRFDGSGGSFQTASVKGTKNEGGSWFAIANNTTSGHSRNPVHRQINEAWRAKHYDKAPKMAEHDALKHAGEGKMGRLSSNSNARKAASAHIAKIPFALSRHVARYYHPAQELSA